MPSEIQSVLFDMNYWEPLQARDWLNNHGFAPVKRMHRGRRFYHYRLQNPDQFDRFRIKKTGQHMEFIIGFY